MEGSIRYLAPGEGRAFDVVGGDVVVVKAGSADTDGSFSVFETTVPPGGGPPPHVHHREDESFYVLEGVVEFQVGDREIRATPGAFLIAPRDIPHRFRNPGPTPARMVIIVRPGGFERFIEEFSRLPANAPPDPAAMMAIARKYGLEFV